MLISIYHHLWLERGRLCQHTLINVCRDQVVHGAGVGCQKPHQVCYYINATLEEIVAVYEQWVMPISMEAWRASVGSQKSNGYVEKIHSNPAGSSTTAALQIRYSQVSQLQLFTASLQNFKKHHISISVSLTLTDVRH